MNEFSKKIIFYVGVFIVVFWGLVELEEFQKGVVKPESLKVLAIEDYVATSEVIEEFERLYNVSIEIDYYEDEFEIFEKDLSEFDLVMMSSQIVGNFVENKELSRISRSFKAKLNQNVDEFCVLSGDTVDLFFYPYLWGTTGVVVNNKFVKNNSYSWDVLWSSKYKRKVLMSDSPYELIIASSLNTMSKVFPESLNEFGEVEKFLKFQKEGVVSYSSDYVEITELFRNESIWAAQVYNSFLMDSELEELDLEYYIPYEGGVAWVDGFVIPRSSSYHKYVELFLSFLWEVENMKKIGNYQNQAVCNLKAKSKIYDEILYNEDIYPGLEEKEKLLKIEDVKVMDDVYLKELSYLSKDLIE